MTAELFKSYLINDKNYISNLKTLQGQITKTIKSTEISLIHLFEKLKEVTMLLNSSPQRVV